jgi:hypothetical protein
MVSAYPKTHHLLIKASHRRTNAFQANLPSRTHYHTYCSYLFSLLTNVYKVHCYHHILPHTENWQVCFANSYAFTKNLIVNS